MKVRAQRSEKVHWQCRQGGSSCGGGGGGGGGGGLFHACQPLHCIHKALKATGGMKELGAQVLREEQARVWGQGKEEGGQELRVLLQGQRPTQRCKGRKNTPMH